MKDIKIELNANEAQGEAYWRKRCDTVEVELSRLRAEVEILVWNLAGISTMACRRTPILYNGEMARPALDEVAELVKDYDRLRAENKALQADAALGRAVRRMPAWTFIYQNSVGWFCGTEMSQGTRTYGPKADTPEAALKAAGLTEVEN